MNLKVLLIGLLVVPCLSGCGTEKHMYRLPLDSRGEERLEKRFQGKTIKIVLEDGQTINASRVNIQADSVSYLERGRDSVESIHFSRLARLETRNRSKGVSRGLGYGFLIGAAWGVAFGLAVSEYTFFADNAPAPVLQSGFAFGVAGGIIGMFTGAVAGVREVYAFTDSARTHSSESSGKEPSHGNDADTD